MKESYMKNNQQTTIEGILGTIVSLALGFWASLLIVSTVIFIGKLPIERANLVLATLGSWILGAIYVSKTNFERKIIVFLTAVVICFGSLAATIWAAGKVFDLSYDGQAYHQEAIVQLNRGWNPIYMQLNGQATGNLERWLNHYPKATWIFAASVYKWTGNIESGKALGMWIPLIALFACWWGIWKLKMNGVLKFLLGFVVAINPVVVYQSLSYYLDGVLVSMLLIVAAIGARLASTRDKNILLHYWCGVVVLVNIKLSAMVFGIMLVSLIIPFLWSRNLLRFSLSAMKVTLSSLIVGILILGFNPYVANFVTRGNLLYPAMGKGAVDYTKTNMPENYWSMLPPVRLMSSIFAEASLKRGDGAVANPKLPFTISPEELVVFRETNAKTSGFGPLFGGVFILSLVGGVSYLVFGRSKRKRTFIVMIVAIIISASMVSINSVARYVPFVWWIPGIVIGAMFLQRRWWWNLLGLVMMGILFLNVSLVASAYFPYNLKASEQVDKQLVELSGQNKKLKIAVKQFGSVKVKLKRYGIDYLETVETVECSKWQRILVHNVAVMCMD